MEVRFTPEQEAQLAKIASVQGISAEQFVHESVRHSLEDASFRASVLKGVQQADQGMLIDEAEMDARVARMFSA